MNAAGCPKVTCPATDLGTLRQAGQPQREPIDFAFDPSRVAAILCNAGSNTFRLNAISAAKEEIGF